MNRCSDVVFNEAETKRFQAFKCNASHADPSFSSSSGFLSESFFRRFSNRWSDVSTPGKPCKTSSKKSASFNTSPPAYELEYE